MLLAIIILWPLSLVLAFVYGAYLQSKRPKDKIKIIHTVPDNIDSVRIVHLDEYMGSVEEIVYKKDSRWMSGFNKVVVKQ